MDVGLLGAQPALLAQRGDDRLLRLGGGQPGEALARLLGHPPVGADHADLLEPVLAADLEVVGVVAGGDLQRAGAELGVDVLVGDDRQPAADQRQHAVLADQVARSARRSGLTATAVSASIVSGRTVATVSTRSEPSTG